MTATHASWVYEGGVLSCACGYSGPDRQHPTRDHTLPSRIELVGPDSCDAVDVYLDGVLTLRGLNRAERRELAAALSECDAPSTVECEHHWHGPFDDLNGRLSCCECGAERVPQHPRSCRCHDCQSEARAEHDFAGWA